MAGPVQREGREGPELRWSSLRPVGAGAERGSPGATGTLQSWPGAGPPDLGPHLLSPPRRRRRCLPGRRGHCDSGRLWAPGPAPPPPRPAARASRFAKRPFIPGAHSPAETPARRLGAAPRRCSAPSSTRGPAAPLPPPSAPRLRSPRRAEPPSDCSPHSSLPPAPCHPRGPLLPQSLELAPAPSFSSVSGLLCARPAPWRLSWSWSH